MGGSISSVANYSRDVVLFGTDQQGVFGFGGAICIGPQTLVPDLGNVSGMSGGDCVEGCNPDPYGNGLCWATDDGCSGLAHERQVNFNDAFWSYLGVVDHPERNCAVLLDADSFHTAGTISLKNPPPPADDCTQEERDNAARVGCNCHAHQPSGGYCPVVGNDGCTQEERDNAARVGCDCHAHQPSGGYCPLR